MRALGYQLQKIRQQKKLTQSALAKSARVTQAMISKVERGHDVQLSTLIVIAKVLGLEITALDPRQAFALRRDASKKSQTLLEQFQVKDDD